MRRRTPRGPKKRTIVRRTGLVALVKRLATVSKATGGAYPKHLEETGALRNGQAVLLRPIRASDAPGLRAAFKLLTPEDVRRRFFRSMKDLSAAMAERLCRIDYDRHMALVALGPGAGAGTDGWGVARLVADPEFRRAEFAIVVRSDVQSRGIGSLLTDRLLAYARSRGIAEVWGDVLADNDDVLAMARKFGFAIGPSPEDPGALRVTKRLR